MRLWDFKAGKELVKDAKFTIKLEDAITLFASALFPDTPYLILISEKLYLAGSSDQL